MRAGRLVHGRRAEDSSIGFFQIGGGIAGDFPICVVPMIQQDLQRTTCRSGATSARSRDSHDQLRLVLAAPCPNEKITWGKLGVDTPKFIIESDATIVAPLIFAYVLGHVRAVNRWRIDQW